jgi:hypothetical protein
MKSWSWVLLVVLSILIKWASWYPGWVERNYSLAVYPLLAKIQRVLFGWIPFSVGDLFYAFLIIVLLYKMFRFTRTLVRKQMNRKYFIGALQQGIFMLLFFYVFFNLFWGLNYNRLGIAWQLKLDVKKYSTADLDTLTNALQHRLNDCANFVTNAQRDSFNKKKTLFNSSVDAYRDAAQEFSFLSYSSASIKPSMYSYLGNYLGFQGYYNPFSGEAQVNTTVPKFLEPYVTTHEIAHQLGYGKENEANFVGYLACRRFKENAFRYSAYLDLYNYAIGELRARGDTSLVNAYQAKAHPQVIKDQKEFRDFYRRYRNPVEPIIMWGYGQFLKSNNQPAGKRTYNEVVAWMIAYYKKYGIDAL